MFKPVPTRVDYVQLEHQVQAFWDEHDTLEKYMARNEAADERWSFIDGPITANNPMGVHHAWGRSYKDLYNRFWTMRGRKLRYQQGFDCQGLWIEVEVEKEKGFQSKRDIETYGVARFVEDCKERVQRFASIMTQQSIRLGYWMDWDNSYFTNSDENNYTIWSFLKKCYEKGWIYKGHDTMPWCPRCGTGISQHEIVTEGYQDITHRSVYLKFPLTGRAEGSTGFTPSANESLLVWTTTPWTLAANVAAAVNPELTYLKVQQAEDVLYVSQGALATAIRGEHEVIGEVKGAELVGLSYSGPFDELPVQKDVRHRVIAWNDVSDAEGTGIVHIAPGAGAEDFALSKEYGLDVIAPLEEDGAYIKGGGFGFLEGKFAGDVPQEVFASLREKSRLYRIQDYTHRYPTCWRCSSELVFRLVDEWFINMDGPIGNGGTETLRDKIMTATRGARWIPEFGLARELDWLRNMHDWMISKKRYYGLALPIYECKACGKFEVIGSEEELKQRASEGWGEFEGHSPHRPYVDAVKIACSACGETVERIKDVGNPWLDAGIVPFSTLDYGHDPEYFKQWFPADWVSESFPGQFRNWFYALLAMGTVMVLDTEFEDSPPFLNLFSYALLRDEKGAEMHKSKGNAIWFDDAADQIGADVMRWLYLRTNPANNLNFGYGPSEELKRGFLSTLWNTYSFFITYASIDGWTPAAGVKDVELSELDRWVLSELNQLVLTVTDSLENYDSMTACRQIEEFVEGLSNWYVRRSRRRFWRTESDGDKQAAYQTLWTCLSTVNRLMAPMTPFLAEDIYQNLVLGAGVDARESVHLNDWPVADESLIDRELGESVKLSRFVAALGHAARNKAKVKVRQPLASAILVGFSPAEQHAIRRQENILLDELNIKALKFDDDKQRSKFLNVVRWHLDPKKQKVTATYGPDGFKRLNALLQGDEPVRVEKDKVVVADFVLDHSEIYPQFTNAEGFFSLIPQIPTWQEAKTVTLDVRTSKELQAEGLAREIVRRIQDMRKKAGLDLSEHIDLAVETSSQLIDEVLLTSNWINYIRQETLSNEVTSGEPLDRLILIREEHIVDDDKVTIALLRR